MTDNKYDVKVFYKGQELLLKKYLEELFPEDKQSLEKAKTTVQNIRNGYQTLDTRNVAEIILGKQNGKDYLRSNQRFVFGKIQERINEKDKTIDIIYVVDNGLRERFRHYTWRFSNR